ncbi:MAG: hypothetical protein DSM107014_00175 [Gomphosphaeria aponina SAG 52.96 = DSM 107014]|uniref:Uncharacterized protein n=1 Tax=Gomphosphaeria aponina SAG 52.96 = DSM 107014 TaxID=1521640 RepID=A0A941JR42_9CHRO|nr:hypothetical protein [Gomphosphaeria aponina SAG 52.96 = DSM 107014]
MTTLTENELKELKDFLEEQFKQVNSKTDKLSEEVNGKIEKLSEEVNHLRVEIAMLKGELTGTNKRLENLEFINRTTSVAITATLLAGVVKLFFPNFPKMP